MQKYWSVFVFFTCFIAPGCGGSKANLSGKVALNSQQLAHAQVTVYDTKGEILATAMARNGEYQFPDLPLGDVVICVQTYKSDGYPVGVNLPPQAKDAPPLPKEVKETMISGLPAEDQEAIKSAKPVPKKYWNPKDSDLRISLKQGMTRYDLEMTGTGEIPPPPFHPKKEEKKGGHSALPKK